MEAFNLYEQVNLKNWVVVYYILKNAQNADCGAGNQEKEPDRGSGSALGCAFGVERLG